MKRQIMLNWRANTSFGWGLLGLNVFYHWAAGNEIQPLMGIPIGMDDVQGTDSLRLSVIAPAAVASNQLLSEVTAGKVDLRERKVLVVHSVGNGLKANRSQHVGIRNVGRCIFENTHLPDADRQLAKYDSLLCGSRWSADLLRANTSKPMMVIHEGIDHSYFFPGPRSGGLDAGRFYIFSGGKVEFRKGHDLVLLAFREFAARHADAVLVSAWHSPFPEVSAGFQGKLRVPLRRGARGELEIQRWAVENGINPRQFIELQGMANSLMPLVLREMDCAIQVSRCEACTNLPAKEAMACGVPVILANNTGVRDLVDSDNCVALSSQAPVTAGPDFGTEGWGESSVDEIVAALEMLYTDSAARKRIGARGAEWIIERQRTWRDHSTALKNHLLGLF